MVARGASGHSRPTTVYDPTRINVVCVFVLFHSPFSDYLSAAFSPTVDGIVLSRTPVRNLADFTGWHFGCNRCDRVALVSGVPRLHRVDTQQVCAYSFSARVEVRWCTL